jgi:thiamine biosynthesis lipoprotein
MTSIASLDAFRAMGTDVSLLGPARHSAAAEAADAVRATFDREEHRFSRFRGDSELTKINRRAGAWTPVSAVFEEVVRISLRAAAATDGRFDPAVLHAVVAAGYDRDFDEVLAGARGALHPPSRCGRWTEIEIRPGEIRLPVEVGLDLGGLAKGWTVDRACGAALAAGLPWALVNAGGDLVLAGAAPSVEVAVDDPDRPGEELLRLRLDEGALATSSVRRRAWGQGLHHVIDPRSGAPATGEAIQATVWAPTCADAEVLATDALLQGTNSIRRLPAVLVTDAGDVLVSMTPAEEAA